MLVENINFLESRIKSEIDAEYKNAVNKVKSDYNNALQAETKFKIALDEQKKKAKALNKVTSVLKEIHLTANTQEHDIGIKAKKLSEFIDEGNKVKIAVKMSNRDRRELVTKVVNRLLELGGGEAKLKTESPLSFAGRFATVVVTRV